MGNINVIDNITKVTGLSQIQLADRVGVSKSTISAWRMGAPIPICDRTIVRDAEVMTKYGPSRVPAFHWQGEVIWGATAMILGELSALFS